MTTLLLALALVVLLPIALGCVIRAGSIPEPRIEERDVHRPVVEERRMRRAP